MRPSVDYVYLFWDSDNLSELQSELDHDGLFLYTLPRFLNCTALYLAHFSKIEFPIYLRKKEIVLLKSYTWSPALLANMEIVV